MEELHNHKQDIIFHSDCPRCKLNAAAPDLLEAAKNFREWWANHFEDYDKDSNGELLCLDNDFEAAISLAEKEAAISLAEKGD